MKKSNIRILRYGLILIVLILSLVLFNYLNKSLGSTSMESVALYQFSSNVRFDYKDSSKLIYEEKEKTSFYQDVVRQNLDFSPLYVNNRVKLIMPEDFSVVYFDTYRGFVQEKMLHLTSIELNNKGLEYVGNFSSGSLPNAILYNGRGLYVLLEESYYELNGSNYHLAPFSFIDYDELNNILRVYDFGKSEAIIYEDISGVKITLANSNYVIDLDTNMISLGDNLDDKKLLMSTIDYLEMYEN